MRTMTCIVCPKGCKLILAVENGTVTKVEGNECKRGSMYASEEISAPKRVLTSTVAVLGMGTKRRASIKTNKAIPKELLFEAMEQIKNITVTTSLKRGSAVIYNLLGTGADVILTEDIG